MCSKESDFKFSREILDKFVRVANEAADAAGIVVKNFFGKPQSIQTFDKCDQDTHLAHCILVMKNESTSSVVTEKPYDFLAFTPIIEGAGGIITDWAGQKLRWQASPMSIGTTYYRIIASGDAQVHHDALKYLIIA